MNVLVVLPSVPRCIKFLQECRVWASSRPEEQTRGVRFEYTGRDSTRFRVGKSSLMAVTPRLLDLARGEEWSVAYVCDIDDPGRTVNELVRIMAPTSETTTRRYPPDVTVLMAGMCAVERARQ